MKELDTKPKDVSPTSRSSSQPSIKQYTNDESTGKPDSVAAKEDDVCPVPNKIPRSQRRGLFGRFTIIAEVDEPKLYPRKIKWFITFVIACAAIAAPLGSTIIFRESEAENRSTNRLR